MALYRQNSTGFIISSASNPGAGYTAISSMPSDLAGRVDWHRTLDTYGQTRGWHPLEQQGTVEKPAPPGLAGSGVNICSYLYTSFESDSGLPPLAHTAMSASQVTGGYHGGKCLQLTTSANPGTTWLNASSSTYNIKLTPNTRWIVSGFVAPLTSGAKSFSLLLKTDTGTEYSLPLTTGATANTFTRVSGVLDLRIDNRPLAVMGVRISGTSVAIKFDAFMLEEMVGDTATPSAFVQPFATIDGSVLEDGSIPNAKIIDLSASKLTAGTINAGTIHVINLSATNLTVGSIPSGRYGSDTIGSGPVVGGALHKQYVLSSQSNTIPYIGSTSINLGSCFVSGGISLPANADRSGCVILVNAYFEWNAVSAPGWLVACVMTGYRSGALLSRYMYYDNGRDLLSFMTFHNAGSSARTYYLGLQQYIANPYSVNCYYDVCVLEFMK